MNGNTGKISYRLKMKPISRDSIALKVIGFKEKAVWDLKVKMKAEEEKAPMRSNTRDH